MSGSLAEVWPVSPVPLERRERKAEAPLAPLSKFFDGFVAPLGGA
jgi:hypothetical protein